MSETALRWIPVEEALPDNNTIVLAAGEKFFRSEGQFHDGEFLFWDEATESLQPLRHIKITHWIEMPPHPCSARLAVRDCTKGVG